MVRSSLGKSLAILLLYLIFCAGQPFAGSGAELGEKVPHAVRTGQGTQVIIDRHPGSSVVCLAVAVEAGSAFEPARSSGVTHFIEHMAFDGCERYTREEISRWIDDSGVFLNAFTRKETTTFFMLLGKDSAERGIEVLSQMLLHSIFPRSEIEKEKNVVLEELRKTIDRPDHAAERISDRYLYRGSGLAGPVLGYPATIESLTREELLDYYHTFYRPDNMKVFVMGGVDVRTILGWIDDYFRLNTAGVPGKESSEQGRKSAGALRRPRWSNQITERSSGRAEEGLDILVRLSGNSCRDLAAANVLAQLLSNGESPLDAGLEEIGLPAYDVSLEIHADFAAFRFHFSKPENGWGDYSRATEALQGLAEWKPGEGLVCSARFSYLSAEAFDREKYHYYLMLHGDVMSLLGERYFKRYLYEMKEISKEDVSKLLRGTFSDLFFNACLIRNDSGSLPAVIPEGNIHRSEFANGCVAGAVKKEDSKVGALHLLIGGRNILESEYGPGYSKILHSIMESSREGRRLEKQMKVLGARLAWGDNPYIPMDDYRLNPSFSFIRLEAPLENFERACSALADHIFKSDFSKSDLKEAGNSLARETAVRRASPAFDLRRIFYRKLFPGHPYGESIFPRMETFSKMTVEGMKRFRRSYFRPEKMTVTVVSGYSLDQAIGLAEGFSCGGNTADEHRKRKKEIVSEAEYPPLPEAGGGGSAEITGAVEGAYLMRGFAAPVVDLSEAAALYLAAEALDRRMQDEIRENLGLAYSTGCSVRPVKGGMVAEIYMGTRASNLDRAREALRGEIERLGLEKPDAGEIRTSVARIMSARARRNLSSINKAYSMGVDLFLFGGRQIEAEIAKVDPSLVSDVIDRYFGYGAMQAVDMIPSSRR